MILCQVDGVDHSKFSIEGMCHSVYSIYLRMSQISIEISFHLIKQKLYKKLYKKVLALHKACGSCQFHCVRASVQPHSAECLMLSKFPAKIIFSILSALVIFLLQHCPIHNITERIHWIHTLTIFVNAVFVQL